VVSGLTITAAHIHNAAAGINGNVVKPLAFSNDVSSGVWSSSDASDPLSDSLLSELLRGRLYVNVHTSANPGGEIRGQITLAAPVGFSATLTGSGENPPVTSAASGSLSLTLKTDGSVQYDATVTGLTPTAAHFHDAPTGVNGAVVKGLALSGNSVSGTWSSSDASQPLTDELLRELVCGRLYMNAHTSTNPGGEIRGQIRLNKGVSFTAKLEGNQQNPPVTTSATGTGWFVLNAGGSQLAYSITVNGIAMTAAHFHNAAAGINGAVVKPLSFSGNTATGVWSSSDTDQPLSDSLLLELLKGRLYVNIHTAANPGGEIRGQLILTSGASFAVELDGTQENPPVATPAAGAAFVVLNTDGSVSYALTATDLTPTAAHFHDAPLGTNGSVVKGLTLTNNSVSGIWTSSDVSQPLTDQLLRDLVEGMLYLNVHTATNPGGEIRGQIVGSTTGSATSVGPGEHGSLPTEFRLEQNYPNPFNPSTAIVFQIARSGMVSLNVYNVLGQLVRTLVDEVRNAGVHTVTFDARDLPSGVYFYRLAVDGTAVETRKMALLK
jgi:hypothetical protein